MRALAAALGALVALGGIQTARAQDRTSGLFIAPQVSTLGLGAEAGYRINEHFAVRGGANFFNLNREFSTDGIEYDGKARLRSFGATADVFPFGGGFRLSGGLRINDNRGDLSAVSMGDVEIGGTTYTAAQVGTLDGRVEFNRVAPYIGIGWEGTIFSPNLYFGADLGVMFQGNPKVSLTATGAAASPQLQADLERERKEVEDKLKPLAFYPVISFSIGYRF